MLPKNKFPQLNRKQRRNPKKFAASLVEKGWLGGGNILLFKLLARADYGQRP